MPRRSNTTTYHPIASRIIDAITEAPREEYLFTPFRPASMQYEDLWMLDRDAYGEHLQAVYERYTQIAIRERNANIRMYNINIPPHARTPLIREATYDHMSRDTYSVGNQRLQRAINRAVREQLEAGRE